MKRIALSVFVIAALGFPCLETQTAEASGWWGSGWQTKGYSYGAYVPVTVGASDQFIVGYDIGPNGSIADGTTQAWNYTGTVDGYHTIYIPTERCNDGSYVNGPGLNESTSGNPCPCVTQTQGPSPNAQGYTGWYSNGTYTGYCPASHPSSNGGVWVWQN